MAFAQTRQIFAATRSPLQSKRLASSVAQRQPLLRPGKLPIFLNCHTRAADLMVVCGPSGCGKTSLLSRLSRQFPALFGYCISHTTRDRRRGEVDGRHYHFISPTTFAKMVHHGEFVEHALVHDSLYGTSFSAIRKVLESNRICTLDVDTVGAKNIRTQIRAAASVAARRADNTDVALNGLAFLPKFVWVQTPSLQVLAKRLKGRGSESSASLQIRVANAEKEIQWFEKNRHFFDATLLNDRFERCFSQLLDFVSLHMFEPADNVKAK